MVLAEGGFTSCMLSPPRAPRPAPRVDVTGAAWSAYGAGIWAATIRQVRRQAPACKVEVLTPDFRGQEMPLARVLAERPDVFNHPGKGHAAG